MSYEQVEEANHKRAEERLQAAVEHMVVVARESLSSQAMVSPIITAFKARRKAQALQLRSYPNEGYGTAKRGMAKWNQVLLGNQQK